MQRLSEREIRNIELDAHAAVRQRSLRGSTEAFGEIILKLVGHIRQLEADVSRLKARPDGEEGR